MSGLAINSIVPSAADRGVAAHGQRQVHTDMPTSTLAFVNGHSPDVDELVRAAMQWHFDEETGTPFWIRKAKSLDFDPRRDVRCHADLAMFPDVAAEWRRVPVDDLVPRGYRDRSALAGTFESGGTTGAPKRVVCPLDWLDHLVSWCNANLDRHGFPRGTKWLGLTPSGPHLVGRIFIESATTFGSGGFTIDLDPRWVKRLIAAGKREEVNAYTEHLIDQTADILRTQDVGVLTITPPLLERLVRREELVDLVNGKVKAIRWGGTQMDPDTRRFYKKDVFPNARFYGHYGNTMTLGVAGERVDLGDGDPCIFDSFSPYVAFSVVDPETRQPVSFGARGRVMTSHVSRAMLLPNNLERDCATRIEPLAGRIGDAVADIAPVPIFEAEPVIEGVY